MEIRQIGIYHLKHHLIVIIFIYLLTCLRLTDAASPWWSKLIFTKGSGENATFEDLRLHDLMDNSGDIRALHGNRYRGSIRTSTRDRDLLIYERLWKAHITDNSNSQSKIEILGNVLKRHVARLRTIENGEVELVFLVDSSASVGLENFFNELKFVKKLLADFTVALWATRVAVITFSSNHRVVANVDQLSQPGTNQHKCSLLKEELPSITYVGGGTYTKGALELAQAVLENARPDSAKAVFLVTDGYSNGGDPLPYAKDLRQSGVEIFTFGIRDGNVQELLSMSSEPQNEHCFIVDNFTEFEALARRALHQDLQVGDFVLESRDKCSYLCPEQSQCCDITATCRCGTHTGQYECVCPPGSYGNGLRGGCQPCPSGTYKAEALPGGVSTCHPCPDPNHVTSLGSASVTQCRCNTGFRTMPEDTSCEEIQCPPLQPPPNGMFVSVECTNTLNSACAMRCNPGYELVGSTIRLCNESGQWTGQNTHCPVKTCDPLSKPSHGIIECDTQNFAVGSVCHVRCNIGYTLVGSTSRRCLPIAQWNGLPNDCRAITCPALPPLPYGFYTTAHCMEQKQYFGTICRAQCDQGFQLEGATNRQCLATGKWEETPATHCVDINPPIITCPDDVIIEAAANQDSQNVTWDMPTITDNTDEELAIMVIPAIKSPWRIRIGSVTLRYVATDNAGNKAQCDFEITVVDTQPPVIDRCRSPDPFLTSDTETEVTWELPQFSDNSGHLVTVYKSHEPGMMASLGVTEVEYLAMDDAANSIRCLIYIHVQRSPCVIPEAPESGSMTCVTSDSSLICSVSCNRGFGFAIAPSPVYHCDGNNGEWFPKQQLPWLDCSAQNAANTGVKALQFELEADHCDQQVAASVESSLTQQLATKVIHYCSNSVNCRLDGLTAQCKDKDALDRPHVDQPMVQALHARQDASTTDWLMLQYNEFKKYSPSNFLVDMNVTAHVNNGRGDTPNTPEVFQQNILNSLSAIPNALTEDLSQGHLDLGIDTQASGAAGEIGTLVAMNTLPSHLVCQPGTVLVNNTVCVQCARGMFYDSTTSLCQRCPSGTYQDRVGQYVCEPCPEGFSTLTCSAKSLEDCTDLCPAGSYSFTGMEQCEGCPQGTYQPNRGMKLCIPCPAGMSTPKTGSISNVECAVPCASGYISHSGFPPCLPCPVGYFQPFEGMISCIQCPHEAITLDKGATSLNYCQDLQSLDYKSVDIAGLPSVMYNDCLTSPCQHDSECYSVPSGYMCSCKPGYTGPTCEDNIDDCVDNECHYNATCIDHINGFTCLCPQGFHGLTCSVDTDECLSELCQHNSSCIDGPNSYQCDCSNGYQGTHCELEVSECSSNPCHNRGQCIDYIGGYLCACLTGFHGNQCDEEVDECLSLPCVNNATCHDHPGYFSCTCLPGFEGVQCEVNSDECASSPCHAGSQCIDNINGFTCNCLPGFSGKMCEIEHPWNFSLVFEHSGTTDYILLEKTLPDLTDVTISFWMQTTDASNYGCPFSYATGESMDNALTLMDYTGFALYINGEAVVTDVTANDGLWHHIVVTWSNLLGEWHIYKDGEEEAMGDGLAVGTLIQGEGIFVIGQEQDIPGGGFNLVESFLGEISLLNMWNRVLGKDDVRALHRSCDKQTDVIQAWPDFLNGITGRVLKVDNHFCQGCFSPLPPRNGNFTGYQPNVTLSTVTYSCYTGFDLIKGPDHAVCQISGEWMPSHLPYCQRVLCGRPSDVVNGRVYVDTYMYGDMVSYRCNTNYTLLGPRARQCQANGRWNGYSPVCKKTSCGLRDIANAQVIGSFDARDRVQPGMSLQYTCSPGYEMIGRNNVTCKQNGRWTSHPECHPIECPRPRVIRNGYIQAAESLTVDNNITYNCVSGYELVGENQRTCLANGEWGENEPRCEPILCGEPPDVEHAIRSGSVYTFGRSVSYMCEVGYVQRGAVTISCMDTGLWSEHPVCIPVACPPLPVLHHGRIIGQQFFYGKSVQLQCDFGYVLRGTSKLNCTEYGRWSAPPATCIPVSCERPSNVEHGNYYGNQFHLGNSVRYICRTGYILIGEKQRTCEGSGEWSGTTPRCEPVTCPHPPNLPNSRLTQSPESSFTYGIIIVYQCVEGYDMGDDEGGIMLCQTDGQWRGLWPTCVKATCGEPPGIAHGTITPTGYDYQDTLSYMCEEGYELHGVEHQTCEADGSWSYDQPQCQPITCVAPPIVMYGTYTGDLYYSRKILYTCERGYEVVGDIVLKCGSDKQWFGQVPRCEPVTCGAPPNVSQSFMIGTNFTFNSTVSYQCNRGYNIEGSTELACSEFRTWVGDIPKCTLVSCDQPPNIPNGLITGSEFTYNSSVSYTCGTGYRQIAGTKLTCAESGNWMGERSICKQVVCSQPPAVDYGDIIGSDYRFNQSVLYKCLTGYNMIGDATIVCDEFGMWLGKVPECKIVTCEQPPRVSKAEMTGSNHTYGNSVVYQCNTGYVVTENAILECDKDGKWVGVIPKCDPVNCSAPSIIKNGIVIGNRYTYNQSVSYLCHDGYTITEHSILHCSESGYWVGDVPECVPVVCDPPFVSNGNTIGNIFSYNNTVSFTCDEGYDLIGNTNLRCSENASWTRDIPKCIPIICEAPTFINNGIVRVEGLVYGSDVTYTCLPGYDLIGSTVLFCSENGTWNGFLPRCEPVTCEPPTPILYSSTIGSDYIFNHTISYQCNYGYEFKMTTDAILNCTENGTWDGDVPECIAVSCTSPDHIDHGYYIGDNFTYGNSVQFICNIGYELYGSSIATCSGDRSWGFESAPPHCIPIQCGAPPTVPNATWNETETVFNATVTYTCVEGYRMSGTSQLVCQLDRTWHGRTLECQPVVCDVPITPRNGGVMGSQFTFGSVVKYFCGRGYNLTGAAVRTCQSNGKWTGAQPECPPVNCGTPPNLVYAYAITSETVLGSIVEYRCMEGYTSLAGTNLYCDTDGLWAGDVVPCEPVDCGEPPALENGQLVGKTGSLFNNSMQHTCNPGYILIGASHTTCLANGSWRTTNARCEPIPCPDLLVPNHASINATKFYFPNSIKFSCDIGYILQGVDVITCGANGAWSYTELKCVPVSCGKPNKIASGSWTYSGTVYESTVWYDCHLGYTLDGVKTQTCLSNGSWSAPPPVCKKVSCSAPEDIQNGSVSQSEVFYGDSATYLCDDGFILDGISKVSCQFDSTFSPKPNCYIVSCGTPQQIKNGRVATEDHVYMSVGTYYCNDGYDLVGDSQTQCLSTGAWRTVVAICTPVSCGLPNGLENGWYEVQNNNITYMAKVIYYCDTGYELIGSEIRTCLATSKWSADNPTCQPVSCDNPPGLHNGFFVTNGTTYLSTAIYECNMGFNLMGRTIKTCQANQTWSKTSQSCKRVSCGEPPTIQYGSFVGTNWTYSGVVHYICDKGYGMNGTRSTFCQADATWSSKLPMCTPVQCNVPQIPVNGNIVTNSSVFEYQTVIQYACSAGYELVGEQIQTCLEDSDWSGVVPQCLPVSCGDPPVILLNGFLLKPGNGTFGSIVRYICEIGYELDGVDYIQCQADGHWSKPWPRCEPITCLFPDHPSNGGVQVDDVTYNSVAAYACEEGFDLVGSKILRCMPDKTWSSDVPKCEPLECGVPPSTEHGSWISDTNDVVTDFNFGAVVEYNCREGYQLVNNRIAMCTAEGNWNVSADSICQKVSCNVPPPVPNGQLYTTALTYRSIITYQCNKGYEIIGSSSGVCKANGQWSIAPPICELITCPIIQAPKHGSVSGSSRYNDLMTFKCHVTYELIGMKQLLCTETGSWNHPAPLCRLRSCDQPPDLPNGVMFGRRYLKGDVVSYRCYSGYILRGSRSRLCLDSYTWSGDPPKCIGLDSVAAVNPHPVCILPCLHGGTCVGPYQCSCPYGYTGYRCEQVICSRRCIAGAMCIGRHSQCPCPSDSRAPQCTRRKQHELEESLSMSSMEKGNGHIPMNGIQKTRPMEKKPIVVYAEAGVQTERGSRGIPKAKSISTKLEDNNNKQEETEPTSNGHTVQATIENGDDDKQEPVPDVSPSEETTKDTTALVADEEHHDDAKASDDEKGADNKVFEDDEEGESKSSDEETGSEKKASEDEAENKEENDEIKDAKVEDKDDKKEENDEAKEEEKGDNREAEIEDEEEKKGEDEENKEADEESDEEGNTQF